MKRDERAIHIEATGNQFDSFLIPAESVHHKYIQIVMTSGAFAVCIASFFEPMSKHTINSNILKIY